MQKATINIIGSILLLVAIMSGCKTKKNVTDKQQVHKTVEDTLRWVSDTLGYGLRWYGPIPPRHRENTQAERTTQYYYESAYRLLEEMLEGRTPINFKRAVFITENAYFSEKLSYEKFNANIQVCTSLCKEWMIANKLNDYKYKDSLNFKKNAAVYMVMKDTIFFIEGMSVHIPFEYDFDDFLGEKEWSNQFVSKLLATAFGNCHSLPYLYKILADELNAEAWLSLAPNHLYIKNYSKKWGWYNTELTSGEFPTDAWVKASGYITLDAIRSRIYMDTLGETGNIALCVYDLAKGYLAQTGNYTDGFVLKCCDLVLKHQPENINAIILKAETLRRQYNMFVSESRQMEAKEIYNRMQPLYVKGLRMGYREMPLEMYKAWLTSVTSQQGKYLNKEISTFIKAEKR